MALPVIARAVAITAGAVFGGAVGYGASRLVGRATQRDIDTSITGAMVDIARRDLGKQPGDTLSVEEMDAWVAEQKARLENPTVTQL
jgi:hypothetical protein